MMKVFRLNEYDWWLAPDLETAIQSAMKECGYNLEETVDIRAHELTWQEMGQLTFHHDDLGNMTFAEEFYQRIVGGITEPEMFASTEM
jgi:hypothetical protein